MDAHLEQGKDKVGSDIFQSIVEAVGRTMDLPVSVWVLDEQSQALKIKAAFGLPLGYARDAFLALGEESVTGEAFKSGKVVAVSDVLSDPRWKYKDIAREMGWKSALCVPIQVHGAVAGVISIYASVKRDFSDLEKQLLTNYAAQIQLTLEAETGRKTLGRLLDIGDEFARLITKEPEAVLREIAKGACEVTGADCAVIYPYDAAREEFYDIGSVAHHGLRHKLQLKDKPRRWGVGARVVREKELVHSNVEQEDPDMLLKSPFIAREGVKAFMGIALEVAGKVLGILYVDFRTPHQFGDEEKDVIRLFAHQAAIAIDNSRLYQQVETRAIALKKLHEVVPALVQIAGTPGSLQAILTQIVQSAQAVLGADLVDLYQYIQSRDEYVLPPIQIGNRNYPSIRINKIYQDDAVCTRVKSRLPQYFPRAQQEPTLTQPVTVVHPDIPPLRFVVRENIMSTAAVPLIAGTEVVGVLFANYRRPQTFPQSQRELAELFASQAAIAIRNGRLFEQRKALQDIARDITRILDKDELLQKILFRSLELLGCEIGSICLLNKATNELGFEYAIGKEVYLSVPFGRGLIGTAAETRKPVRVGDVTKDPRYIEHVAATRSELDVPMLISDELVGVLNAESTRYNAFDEDSEELAAILAGQAAVALYNAGLYRQTQERLEQRLNDLKALQDIYDAVGQIPLEKILRLVVEQGVSLTQAQYGNLWLLDREQQELRIGTEINLLNSLPRRSDRIPLDEHSINGWVALTREAYLCKDVAYDAHYQMIIEDVRSELAVPLYRGDRIIGTLNVESTELGAFTEDHLRLLLALAGQAAIVIDSARAHDRLNMLTRVSQAVTSTLELDKVLESILDESLKVLGAANGTVLMLNRSTGELELKVRRGAVGERIFEKFTLGMGMAGWVAEHGQPLLAGDVRKEPRYLESLSSTRCELDVPIKVEERTIGVLNIEHPQPYTLDEDDLHLLEAIANQVAAAIRNAQLYKAMRTVNEVGRALTSGIRLRENEVLDLIRSQVSKLMDTDNMYIALYDEATDTVRFGLAYVDGKRMEVETDERWQPRKGGKGRTEEIICTKKPIFHATKAESEAWYADPEHKDYWKGISRIVFPSWLGVPMMVGQRVLGVIATYHPKREYVYSGDDLAVLQGMANQAAIALDNSHMFYDVNRRLQALVEFGQEVTSGIRLNERHVLELIRNQASKLMDTDNMYIALHDEATDTVRFGLAYLDGMRIDVEAEERWQPRKAGKGRTEEIIHTKTPIFSATRAEAEAWYAHPEHREYVGAISPSWLGVPMIVGQRVLGVIATYHPTREYVYSGDDLAVLQGMANQAAIALDNAQLLGREVKWTQQLTALQDIGIKITSQHKLEDVLGSIVEHANAIMSADFSTLFPYDPIQDRFASGIRRGKVEVEPSIPGNIGFSARIAKTRESVFVEDAEQQPHVKPTFIQAKKVKSFAGVPLAIGERTVGVLYVNFFESHTFPEEERKTIQLLANQAVVAIENANLYAEMEQRVEEQTRQLREAQEKALVAEVNAKVGLLTAEVAHHTKNLAGIIRTCAVRLQKQLRGLTRHQKDDLETILFNSEGINKAAEDLFKPFRPEPKAQVGIHLMLHEALDVLGRQPDIDIRVNVSPDLPKVTVQAQKVATYITELLNNAVKYTRKCMKENKLDRGQIEVDGRLAEDGFVELTFTNHGPAIPREQWEEIFELFSAREGVPGQQSYGLGLWGARTTMQAHGGNVCVLESNEEKTIFSLRLPARQQGA